MSTSLRVKVGATLLLLFGVAACEGDNLFPGFGISNGAPDGGTIQGSVTSAGVGVGAVPVILIGIDSTATNSLGEYAFTQLPASTYSLAIRVPLNFSIAPGDSVTQNVTLPAGGTAVVNWRLVALGPIP